MIRLDEAVAEEITSLALRYLLAEVGDVAAIGTPQREPERWRIPVVLRPEGQSLGALFFSLDGTALLPDSTPPQELARAADAI
jgi:hypothetical protein